MKMRTIEEFETSRIASVLEGSLILVDTIKKWYHRYMTHRQKTADKVLSFYIKNHADAERYLDIVKYNNLYLLK